jgi:methanogenic corrinoid protein MtbC1
MTDLTGLQQALRGGKADETARMVNEALTQGIPAKDILEGGLLAAMATAGEDFRNNVIFVPEILIAARALNAALDVLRPHLAAAGVEPAGTVILGTVFGDLHDIGKNLVKIMLEGAGLNVVDLGTNVPAEKFVEAAIEHNSPLIAASALLTTTMAEMEKIAGIIKERSPGIKLMIGGAPVTDEFRAQIGADFYAADAATAAQIARDLF